MNSFLEKLICRYLMKIMFSHLLIALIIFPLSATGLSIADGRSETSETTHSVQNINNVIDYLLTLKRSQDEIFRTIDRLTKTVEEKEHEDHKFRVKVSRKVHILENKVFSMEQLLNQNVAGSGRKLDDAGVTMRYSQRQPPIPEPLISPVSTQSTSQIIPGGNAATLIQQPYIRYQPYQRHIPTHRPNWGYFEHPITHKRVSNANLYEYEPPTRDLPLISLVATAQPMTTGQGIRRTTPSLLGAYRDKVSAEDDDDDIDDILFGIAEEPQQGRKIEGSSHPQLETMQATLQSLRENVTNLEKEMYRNLRYQSRTTTDSGDLHKLLLENSKEVLSLQQNHQEMVHRIEHFVVEIEKTAAKREHAVNESLKEMLSELKKQVNSLKTYTKRQIQNITSVTANFQQPPDKLKCAQTLLDELLYKMYMPKGAKSSNHLATQPDLISDQADEKVARLMSHTSSGDPKSARDKTDDFSKELQLQRKEILSLRSEIARLNISQLLLKRTVDEETLKRKVRPRDCSEIRLLRNVSSGVYSIFPNKNDVSIEVLCDMTTDGGGWTVIQRRGEPLPPNTNGSGNSRISFQKNWDEYEQGFGSLDGDFWLGLSSISALCQLGIQQLRIDLTDWSGEKGYATYQYFKISNNSDLYRIHVSGYSGTVGDGLNRHNGMAFSTPDKDNDVDSWRHCAKTYFSGWWYYACFESNLNGAYHDMSDTNSSYAFGTGIIWQHWKGSYYSLKHVEMKIRNTFIGESQYGNLQ